MRWIILTILIVLFFSACMQTHIQSIRDPELSYKSYRRIVVLANFKDIESRQMAEQVFVDGISRYHVLCAPSTELFDASIRHSNEEILDTLKSQRVDGILVITLSDVDVEQIYVPPSSTTSGKARVWGDTVYFDSTTTTYGGYFVSRQRVKFEIKMLDVANGKISWQASTITRGTNFTDIKGLMESLADSTIWEMKKQRLMARTEEE